MHFSTAPRRSAAATPRRARARNAVPELHTLTLHGEMRASLAHRRAATSADLDEIADEIEDRFGPPSAAGARQDGERLVWQRAIAPEEQPSVVAEILEVVAAPD